MLYFYSNTEKHFESLSLDTQYSTSFKIPTFKKHELLNLPFFEILIVGSTNQRLTELLWSIETQHYSNLEINIIFDNSDCELFEHITNTFKNVKIYTSSSQKDIHNIFNLTTKDYVIILDGSCILKKDSLYYLAQKLGTNKPDIIYSDEELLESETTLPFFKPDWSPCLFYSFNYLGDMIVFSALFLKKSDFLINPKNIFSIILQSLKHDPTIMHIRCILYQSISKSNSEKEQNLNYNCKQLEEFFVDNDKIVSSIDKNTGSLTYKSVGTTEKISIIILTKNNLTLLNKCISSIEKSSYKNYEIIIINNGKKLPRKFYKNYNIIEYEDKFNFSKMNNEASKYAKGQFLLFLNDDVEIINEDWLENLLFYANMDSVGVVGSLLLFPKSWFYPLTIQHGGIALGIVSIANHAFSFSHYEQQNYFNMDKISRNVSAVTGACMLVKKKLFMDIGRFDETLPVMYNDVDLCLRIKKAGYEIVYCPHSKLYHKEGASRGYASHKKDEIMFLNKWVDALDTGDDFYNPNLTHINRNFRINPFPEQTHALSLLKEIWYMRDDLKMRFNIDHLSQLIDWASTEGLSCDECRNLLLPYSKFFLDHSTNSVKELANAIYRFNLSHFLQDTFPEVFAGKYDRLLSYDKTI